MENNRVNPVITEALLLVVVSQRVSENLNRIVDGGRDIISGIPAITDADKLAAERANLEMVKIACDQFYNKMLARLNKK